MEFWGRQNSSSDLHQSVGNVESELLDVGVVVEVCFPDQVVDLALAIRRRSSRGFDHRRRLHVSQLLDAALALEKENIRNMLTMLNGR